MADATSLPGNEHLPAQKTRAFKSVVTSLVVMALGLGFGVAIGLWTEADDDDADTVPVEATSSSRAEGTVRPSILGELRAQQPKLPRTGKADPDDPEPKRETAALGTVRQEAVAPPMPAWLRNAVAIADTGDRPLIAVVIDDAGLNRAGTARLNSLPSPLTISFISYAGDLDRQTAKARAAGHEIFLHVPMAPQSSTSDPGPRALLPELPESEIRDRLDWALSRFSGFVGVNNHMGSRFTRDESAMATVLQELKDRGLAFLDSRTTDESVGGRVAKRIGMPFAIRDVFLDHEIDADEIRKQLRRLEERARRRGSAKAIGHPHRITLDVLEVWLPSLAERGFVLVPVSAIIKRDTAG